MDRAVRQCQPKAISGSFSTALNNCDSVWKSKTWNEHHGDILPGLRHLTINRANFWFDVDEENESVRILAVFFGGQDHVRHMLTRLIDS